MSQKRNPKPPYPSDFRQQMVEVVKAGCKPTELAKEFGCHETSISNWVRQASGMPVPAQAAPLSSDERHELIELRRKLRQVQFERDILAKGNEDKSTVQWTVDPRNAWFAVKSEKTFTASTNS